MLTATRTWRGHFAATLSAWRNTHSPIGTMSPVCSAIGTNSPGGMAASPGGRQRSSASKQEILLRLTLSSG